MNENWLHIYAQGAWHDDSFIVGCPQALRRMGEALIRAADGGKLEVSGGMTSDGEGYTVTVLPMDEQQMQYEKASRGIFWHLPLPYTEHDLTGMPEPPWPGSLIVRDRYEKLVQETRA